MARRAALANGLVFEDKRAPLRRVALSAGVPFRGQRGSPAFHRRARMRVVAIAATDFAFQDRVMVRQIEFATLVEVALETNLRRSFGINDRVGGATGFVVSTARPVAGLAAYIRCIGTLGLQQRVSGCLKTLGNVFVTLLTSLRSNKGSAGYLRRRHDDATDTDAGDYHGPNQQTCRNQPCFLLVESRPFTSRQ